MKDTQFITDMRDIIEQLRYEGNITFVEGTKFRLSLINPINPVKMDNDTYLRTKGKVTGEKII